MKIIFSDIDGTLLNADREPSPALKTEVARLTDNGIPFILISSRPPAAMTWIQEILGVADQPLVAYNGGLVRVDNKTILSQVIPLGIVRHVEMLNRALNLSVQLYHDNEWYVEEMDHYARREQHNTRVDPQVRSNEEVITDWNKRDLGAHKIMVMGAARGIDEIVKTLAEAYPEDLHLYRSKDDYLEIASKEISKLTGIEAVLAAKYPHLSLADCMAFGDNFNDIEMLAGVGLGVAVANARPEVMAVANRVTLAAKADGVAVALEQLF